MGFLDSQKAKERDLSDLRARAQEKLSAGVGQFVLPFPTGTGNTFDRQRRLDMATDALEAMGLFDFPRGGAVVMLRLVVLG